MEAGILNPLMGQGGNVQRLALNPLAGLNDTFSSTIDSLEAFGGSGGALSNAAFAGGSQNPSSQAMFLREQQQQQHRKAQLQQQQQLMLRAQTQRQLEQEQTNRQQQMQGMQALNPQQQARLELQRQQALRQQQLLQQQEMAARRLQMPQQLSTEQKFELQVLLRSMKPEQARQLAAMTPQQQATIMEQARRHNQLRNALQVLMRLFDSLSRCPLSPVLDLLQFLPSISLKRLHRCIVQACLYGDGIEVGFRLTCATFW